MGASRPIGNDMLGRLIHRARSSLGEQHLAELLKGGATSLTTFGLGRLMGVAFVLLVTRLYGAATYGSFALALTLLIVCSVVGRLGLNIALLRMVAEHASQGRLGVVKDVFTKALAVTVPAAVVLAAVFYASADFLATSVFGQPALATYFRIMALVLVPHVVYQLFIEGLRGLKRILAYGFFVDVSIFLVASITLIVLAGRLDPALATGVSYLVGVTTSFVAAGAIWLRASAFFTTTRQRRVELRGMLAVAMPLLLGSSLVLIMNWADNIMLGIMTDASAVGVYDVVFRLSVIAGAALQAVNGIAAPKFAECYGAGDVGQLRRIVKGSTRIIFWSTLPVVLVCVAFPRFLLGLFGAEFESGAVAFVLLLLGTFVSAISGSVGFILRMTGKERVYQNIVLVATIMNIVLNAILIPIFGISGAAFASMTSIVFWNLACVYVVRRVYGFYTIYFPFSRYLLPE
jgi:O-antigen/teichoic acid export membrane protein